MIDTSKYEWDSKCRMVVIDGELYQRGSNGDFHLSLHDEAVAQIIADAPLILQAYKELRSTLDKVMEYAKNEMDADDFWAVRDIVAGTYVGDEEE